VATFFHVSEICHLLIIPSFDALSFGPTDGIIKSQINESKCVCGWLDNYVGTRLEVLTAMFMKIQVFCDLSDSENEGSELLHKAGNSVLIHMALYP
jgi:hypothetical protein